MLPKVNQKINSQYSNTDYLIDLTPNEKRIIELLKTNNSMTRRELEAALESEKNPDQCADPAAESKPLAGPDRKWPVDGVSDCARGTGHLIYADELTLATIKGFNRRGGSHEAIFEVSQGNKIVTTLLTQISWSNHLTNELKNGCFHFGKDHLEKGDWRKRQLSTIC